VLGSPISHSLSPVLHMTAYAELGLSWWRYEAIECDEAGLPGFLDLCGPDWAGLSLTMPLKRSVLPLIDRAEPLVTEVGAANTVIFTAAQRQGYNTDVPGMVRAMSGWRAGGGASAVGPGTGQALIIGGGATACAALAALRDIGVWSAAVAVRDPARTVNVRAAAGRLGMTITLRPFEPASAADAQLVISTAPAGAADVFAGAFAGQVDHAVGVFDVVYHPWPTSLAVAAEQAGATVIGGFDLLLYQAAAQVELLTGRPAPVEEMRQAGLAELARRSGTVVGQ
jgi:shikimate 5-dehydrogenase